MDTTSSPFQPIRTGLQTATQDVILMIARYLNRLELLSLSQSCQAALRTSQQFSAYWKHDLIPALLPENGFSPNVNAQDYRLAALRSSHLKARLQLTNNKPTKVVNFKKGCTAGCYDTWTGKLIGQWTSPNLNKWGPPEYRHQVDSLCISANEIVLAVAYDGAKLIAYRLRVLITLQRDTLHAEFSPESPHILPYVKAAVKRVLFGEGFMALVLYDKPSSNNLTRVCLWQQNGEHTIPLVLELKEAYNERVVLESGKLLMYQAHFDQRAVPTPITLHAFSLHKINGLFSFQGSGINSVILPTRGTHLCGLSELRNSDYLNVAEPSLQKSSSQESWIELIAPKVPNTMGYIACTIEDDEGDNLAYKVTIKRAAATKEIPIDPFISVRGIPPVYWRTMNIQWRYWSSQNRDYEYRSLTNSNMDPVQYPLFNSESGWVVTCNSNYDSLTIVWLS